MVETGHHHQHPPAPAAAGHPPVPSMAMARNMGTTWPPAEQLHHLQYCIHSNPSWR